jgi:hypothetical protein
MVLAGKIFKVELKDLGIIASKLKDFRKEEIQEIEGKSFSLLTEVKELKMGEILSGFVLKDYVLSIQHKDGRIPFQATRKTRFSFIPKNGELLLLIIEKKQRANSLASFFSEVILSSIVEGRISHDTLKTLHESNPEATKVIFFDDVDLPNINKLSLYGAALANTQLYLEYLRHGKIWYVVFETKGMVVGITRNCVITFFSRIEEKEMVEWVRREIVPLIG